MNVRFLSSGVDDHNKLKTAFIVEEGADVTIGWSNTMVKCDPAKAKGFIFRAYVDYEPGKPSAGFNLLPNIQGAAADAVLVATFPEGRYDAALQEVARLLTYTPDVVPVRPA